MQEQTRQQEYMVKVKEYEAHIEQAKVEQKRVDHEERRKTMTVCVHNCNHLQHSQEFLIFFIGRNKTSTTTSSIPRSTSTQTL